MKINGKELDVLAIVQARMNSHRFPGKVLEELHRNTAYPAFPETITVLETVCRRLEASKTVDFVVVATSDSVADSKICNFCNDKNIMCLCGSEENVMHRISHIIDSMACDIVVDITADCPLIEPPLVDLIVSTLAKENLDYCSNVMERTYPDGLDIQAYTQQAFMRLANEYPVEKEHTGYNFVKFQKNFKCKNICAPGFFCYPNWELTVDYPQDLDLLRILVDWAWTAANKWGVEASPAWDFNTMAILNTIKCHPALLRINQRLPRKRMSNVAAEIQIEQN